MLGFRCRRAGNAATQPTQPQEDALAGPAGIALTKEFLDTQIRYYDREAKKHSSAYHGTKAATIIVAAVIPFLAGRTDMAVATGLLGVVIVIPQGLQQLFNVHENWIRYRSTCEALRNQRFLFGAPAGPHAAGAVEVERRLAEQVAAIVRQEYSRWATVQQQPTTDPEKGVSNGATTATAAPTARHPVGDPSDPSDLRPGDRPYGSCSRPGRRAATRQVRGAGLLPPTAAPRRRWKARAGRGRRPPRQRKHRR